MLVQRQDQAHGALVPNGLEALQKLFTNPMELKFVTDFLQSLLKINLEDRATAQQALADPFLAL